MKNQSKEKRYMPEIPQKEIEELRKSIKTSSQRVIAENIERMKKTSQNRPEAMQYFDEIANFFGQREKEIQAAKESGKKVIGYFCMFAPTELILAADAIPVRVNSGWYDAAKLGDRVVPVEVCPIIRSTIGAKMISLSPYLELSDALISVTNMRWHDKTRRNSKRFQASLDDAYSTSKRFRPSNAVLA